MRVTLRLLVAALTCCSGYASAQTKPTVVQTVAYINHALAAHPHSEYRHRVSVNKLAGSTGGRLDDQTPSVGQNANTPQSIADALATIASLIQAEVSRTLYDETRMTYSGCTVTITRRAHDKHDGLVNDEEIYQFDMNDIDPEQVYALRSGVDSGDVLRVRAKARDLIYQSLYNRGRVSPYKATSNLGLPISSYDAADRIATAVVRAVRLCAAGQ